MSSRINLQPTRNSLEQNRLLSGSKTKRIWLLDTLWLKFLFYAQVTPSGQSAESGKPYKDGRRGGEDDTRSSVMVQVFGTAKFPFNIMRTGCVAKD